MSVRHATRARPTANDHRQRSRGSSTPVNFEHWPGAHPRAWWYEARVTREEYLAAIIGPALECAPDPAAGMRRAVDGSRALLEAPYSLPGVACGPAGTNSIFGAMASLANDLSHRGLAVVRRVKAA